MRSNGRLERLFTGPSETKGIPEGKLAFALFDAGSLAGELAHIEDASLADLALAIDFEGSDARAVKREDAFDGHAVGHLADGDGFADSRALLLDDDTLERLDAFLGAFDDLDVHRDGVAGAECRKIRFLVFLLNRLDVKGHIL